eukprot:3751923-Pleurochrysis_carterae.AAC.1
MPGEHSQIEREMRGQCPRQSRKNNHHEEKPEVGKVEKPLRVAEKKVVLCHLRMEEKGAKQGSATAPAACARALLWRRCMRVRPANY